MSVSFMFNYYWWCNLKNLEMRKINDLQNKNARQPALRIIINNASFGIQKLKKKRAKRIIGK